MDADLQDTQARANAPSHRADSYLPVHERFAIAALVTAVSLWIRIVDVIPDKLAARFTPGRSPAPVDRILTTVLFTDIVGATKRVATVGDRRWRAILDAHDEAVRNELIRFGGREINTTGDGFLASFDGPARAIRCAQAITSTTASLGIELRAGLHTGECEMRGADLAGLAVHIAARVGALADPQEVWVSSTVRELAAGSGIAFCERGEYELKGVPGRRQLFVAKP